MEIYVYIDIYVVDCTAYWTLADMINLIIQKLHKDWHSLVFVV